MDKRRLAQWLMVPITVLLVVLLLAQVSISDIFAAFSSVSPVYLAVSFLMFFLLYAMRAARFYVMLNARDMGSIFNITCTHSMANNVMPFRTGELTFVYLARTRMGVQVGVGAAIVAIARLYDVLAICLLFMATFMISGGDFGYFSRFIPAVAVFTVLLAVAIVAIVWFNRYFAAFTARVFSLTVFRWGRSLQAKVDQVCGYCSSLKPGRNTAALLGLSLSMWIVQALNYYLLSSGMGLHIGFWAAISGMLLAIIFVALPIQGVGNFGSFELAWAAIFVALGAPAAAAVSSGFAVHVITLAFTTLIWLGSTFADRLFKDTKHLFVRS
jgi:uncharacterized protein (TIRG00374 family)